MRQLPPLRRQHPGDLPPVRRRELLAWASYDFANSGYTTVVITAVFNAWFVATIAAGADWATLAWTVSLSLSYLLVMLTAPVLGVWVDLRAGKRPVLVASTLVCVMATAGLAACGPGDIALAVALVVLSNYAYSIGEGVVAAFLPELATDQGMGRLSGYGWAFGYVGGLLVLAVCLWWIQSAPQRGVSLATAVPQTLLITAAMFGLAALPTLLLLRERARPQPPGQGRGLLAEAGHRLRQALAGSRGLVDLRRLLVCIVVYQSGVATVITVAAIFTTQALGFSQAQSITLILVVNVSAAVGAFAFGALQDRVGHRAALAASLLGWLLAVGLFSATQASWAVWTAANIAGLCMGASQSVGRALVGYLCPPEREGEVFGLWSLAVRLAMILGPVGYGVVSWTSGGNHRLAMIATGAYFLLGLVLLARVDPQRGHRAARQPA
ncbi:MAG: MFS transporter [Xanthomonadales bacterium]|nr:MFS transporter [Xanthomonadales bacterium]